MLFFDSHSDTNSPFLNHYTKNYDYDEEDIGCVNISILLNYEKSNGFHWFVPDNHPFSYIKTTTRLTNDFKLKPVQNPEIIKDKYDNHGNLLLYLKMIFNNEDYVKYKNCFINDIQPIEYTITNIEYFNYFKNITNEYILNIDLDYFFTNGNVSAEQIIAANDTNVGPNCDIISDDINRIDFEFHSFYKEKKTLSNIIHKEMDSIRKKIDNFLLFINKIKLLGKIPKMIIFSDSSRCDFNILDDTSGLGTFHDHYFQNNMMNNHFLPKRYAFWLRNTLFNNIKLLFNEDIEIL